MMRIRIEARVAATVLIGIRIGVGAHAFESSYHAMGKQVYLLEMAARFDISYATLHSVTNRLFFGIVTAAAILGAYELLALGISALSKRRSGGA
jgi:hypothetical protein